MAESQGLDPRHDPIYQRGYDPAVHGVRAAPADNAPTRRSRARRTSDEDLFAPPGHPAGERVDRAPERRATESGSAGTDSSSTAPSATESGAPQRIAPPAWSPLAELSEEDTDTPPPAARGADGLLVVGSPESRRRDADGEVDPLSLPPWRNPYLLGLTVGGAVLALLGFQMFRAALETIYVDFPQSGVIYGGAVSDDDTADPTAELVSMQIGWSIGPLLFVLGIAAILAVLVFVAVRWRPPRSPSTPSPTSGDEGPGEGDVSGPDRP